MNKLIKHNLAKRNPTAIFVKISTYKGVRNVQNLANNINSNRGIHARQLLMWTVRIKWVSPELPIVLLVVGIIYISLE